MATKAAGSARYNQRAAFMRRRLFVTLIVIVVLAVAAVAARTFIFPKASKPVVAAKSSALSMAAKQSADVDLLAGAIGQYAAANNVLPEHLSVASSSSLVLCGDVCNPTLYAVTGFSIYTPSDIKLMGYTPGLAAPNQNTIYLVPGAKCGSDGTVGAVDPTPRSMVLLYATTTTTSTTPRCVVL
jgi:hypothetical protein